MARLNRIEARLRGELALLKDQLKRNPAAQKSVNQLEKKITTLKSLISPPTQKVDSPSSAAGYPTSCMDLYQRGHFLNAFYPVLKNDKIDFIFCNFTSQSLLSYQDRGNCAIKRAKKVIVTSLNQTKLNQIPCLYKQRQVWRLKSAALTSRHLQSTSTSERINHLMKMPQFHSRLTS